MKKLASETILPGSRITLINYRLHLSRYYFASRFCDGSTVLDAGCGTGFGSYFLIRKGARSVIGIDISPEAVDLAQASYAHPHLSYRTVDFMDFAPSQPVDVITSMGTLDHFARPQQPVAKMRSLLAGSGCLIASVLNRHFLVPPGFRHSGDPWHHEEFGPDDLVELLRSHFSEVRLFGDYHSIEKIRLLRGYANLLMTKFPFLAAVILPFRRLFNGTYAPITYDPEAALADVTLDAFTELRSEADKQRAFNILAVARNP